MNLFDRKITLLVNYFLDNICPPILRDCKYFMYPIMRLAYGRETKLLLEFKEKFPFMSDSELSEYYRRIVDVPINTKRKTDVNKTCLDWIVKSANSIEGTVLDVGCGRGYILSKIMESNPNARCTGVDLTPPPDTNNEKDICIDIRQADITNLPFTDKSFDMVVCTHTLEHIREPQKALSELIRVAKRRLVIVLPRQREYRYTVDFHVNFYPYMYSFKRFIGVKDAVYLNLDG
ncbi:MAG: class I SAM-dependent methyltransferase, partial [Chitinispirillales bacterium]|nr:class I SAM-dependent methyltransferase [Chitinispirillales bacterium]